MRRFTRRRVRRTGGRIRRVINYTPCKPDPPRTGAWVSRTSTRRLHSVLCVLISLYIILIGRARKSNKKKKQKTEKVKRVNSTIGRTRARKQTHGAIWRRDARTQNSRQSGPCCFHPSVYDDEGQRRAVRKNISIAGLQRRGQTCVRWTLSTEVTSMCN